MLRLLSDGEFHSGEALARVLGVSRTTVWKALQGMEALGVTLFKVHGRGYRLVTPVDWLDAGRVRRHLGPRAESFQVHVLDAVGSTSTLLLAEALAGAPSGLTLAAEVQTAGRGRRGHRWYSGLGGGLTFSVLWRFERGVGDLGGLSLAASVGLVRALRELGGDEVQLKWPNDLLWRYHKLGGVLTEIEGDVMGPSAAVIGIGVNAHVDPAVRHLIDQAVTDLAAAGVHQDRNRVLGSLLRHLADTLELFAAHGFAPMKGEWMRYDALAGRAVAVSMPDRSEHAGIAAGVADDGALQLQTAAGLRRIHSGDVSLRPLEGGLRRAG